MNYEIINKTKFKANKDQYINKIKKLFYNDLSSIANIEEFSKHLEFIFNDNISNDAFLVLLLDSNEDIISMINFLQYNNIDNLWCLFTKDSYRKQGYGEKVLKFGIDELKKRNATLLISGIEKDNIPSIALHEKIGFVYSGKSWNELADGFPSNHLGFIYNFN